MVVLWWGCTLPAASRSLVRHASVSRGSRGGVVVRSLASRLEQHHHPFGPQHHATSTLDPLIAYAAAASHARCQRPALPRRTALALALHHHPRLARLSVATGGAHHARGPAHFASSVRGAARIRQGVHLVHARHGQGIVRPGVCARDVRARQGCPRLGARAPGGERTALSQEQLRTGAVRHLLEGLLHPVAQPLRHLPLRMHRAPGGARQGGLRKIQAAQGGRGAQQPRRPQEGARPQLVPPRARRAPVARRRHRRSQGAVLQRGARRRARGVAVYRIQGGAHREVADRNLGEDQLQGAQRSRARADARHHPGSLWQLRPSQARRRDL